MMSMTFRRVMTRPVPGDEPFEAIEFASARLYAAPAHGDRVLAAMLCTDIVESTAHLAAWR